MYSDHNSAYNNIMPNLSKYDLEKLHCMARAYYHTADAKTKKSAQQLFSKMDKNEDGNVSHKEFMDFVSTIFGPLRHDEMDKIFHQLDVDENERLDFGEAITFYYIMQSKVPWCADCGVLLVDAHFICARCFGRGHSYDLCVNCFSSCSPKHMQHDNCEGPAKFLDNNHLLRTLQESTKVKAKKVKKSAAKQEQKSSGDSSGGKFEKVMNGVELVDNLSDLCSIM